MFELVTSAFDSKINIIFGAIIISVLAYSISSIKKNRQKSFSSQVPTLLTTLGILGTFVGIYIGLYEFDVKDIDGSIPNLLAGLKIAFATSILGMVSAIIVKIYQSMKADRSEEVDTVSPEDIYSILKEVKNVQEEAKRENREVLLELKNSISSDQDTSLVTHIQKLRLNIDESFKGLREDFRNFAEKIAQDNTEALIAALEEVIKDFNAKINEQFGENFKHLNQAVGAMLDWQKEYKSQVETLNDTFKKSVENIEKIETSIKGIEASIAEIQGKLSLVPETLESIEGIVRTISNETEELDERLYAFSELKKDAINAFPVIKENLDFLSQELKQIVTEAIERTSETLDDFGTQLKKLTEKQDAAITSSLDNMKQHINQLLEHTKEHTNELLQKTFEVFDEQMQKEVERTISALGSGLASLSAKFVEDYAPLTDKLRELVLLAQRVTENQRI